MAHKPRKAASSISGATRIDKKVHSPTYSFTPELEIEEEVRSFSPQEERLLAHLRSSRPKAEMTTPVKATFSSRNNSPEKRDRHIAAEISKNAILEQKLLEQRNKYKLLESKYKQLLAAFYKNKTVYEEKIQALLGQTQGTRKPQAQAAKQATLIMHELSQIKERVLAVEQLSNGLKSMAT